MGIFYFDVPESVREYFRQSWWADAYICGIEGVPWPCQANFDHGRLIVRRGISASGKLHLTCPVKGIGFRTLSTCSLRSTEDPYLLALELARGSCDRARVQSDTWRRAGLTIRPSFEELLREGTSHFLDAAQGGCEPGPASLSALRAIEVLERAISELGECYATQAIAFRQQREEHRVGTLLAASVIPPSPSHSPRAKAFHDAFNSAAVRLNWADIETASGRFDYEPARATIRWCVDNGLRVIAGPLFDFRERLMPHWLYLMEDDFDSFLSSVSQFVERTVSEFRGSVQLWNCASGLNTPGPLSLNDEQLMRLAMCVLQAVRQCDPNTPAVVSFDQPFGEYMAKYHDGISPLHFADALTRSGLGLAGLGLEVRYNDRETGTLPRSAVEFGEMIDNWAALGIPLLVQFGAPGDQGSDPRAMLPAQAIVAPEDSADPAAEQLRIAQPILRTLLAKPAVHGIVWEGWSDAERHLMAHSGVLDAAGSPRPVLEYLTRLRREFLT